MSPVKPDNKKPVKVKKAVKKETAGLDMEKNGKNPPQPSLKGGSNAGSPPLGGVRGDLEMTVYNTEGKEVEKIKLPENIFGLKVNQDLVKQAYEAQMSQARVPYAHTKNRGEVSGGGKKPWRQKGTGRARHGSTRSPIWKGGGVTHGPRKEKIYAKDINKKMKRSALLMVLSGKARDNELIILDDLKLERAKTKLMAQVIKNLTLRLAPQSGARSGNKVQLGKGALVAMAQKDENIICATRNIPKFMTIGANNLNVVDLLNHKYILMTKEAIEIISNTFTQK